MNINILFRKSFITFLMVLTTLFILTPQPSDAITQATINQKQKQTRAKIKHLKVLEKLEKSKLVKNQQKLETTSSNLEDSKDRFNSMQGKLSQMERDLAKSQSEFSEMDSQIKHRIRQVFKRQRLGMFELILSAKDMNSLLDVVYFERIVIKRDYQRMVAIRIKAAKLAKMKQDVEAQKRYLAQTIQNIDAQQKSIQHAIAQNHNMIQKLKTNRAAYERSERELERQSESLQRMISRNYEHSTVKITSAGFMRPIGGRITSPFGWRTHPIFNSRTFHSGVDIGGPNMGSIRASNSGKVIYSGWYGGYGKVVIIDHGVVSGKPMTTLYAHMSTIKVGSGQAVTKGQVIGLEGTTGYSTGPHCHFEVRINGKPNNPLNYI